MEESELLDTSILITGKSGLTSVFSVIEHPPCLYHCTVLWPLKEDYDRALDLAWKLRLQGTPLGCTDLLIASMCLNRGLTLVTKDHGFKYVQQVERELKLKVLS